MSGKAVMKSSGKGDAMTRIVGLVRQLDDEAVEKLVEGLEGLVGTSQGTASSNDPLRKPPGLVERLAEVVGDGGRECVSVSVTVWQDGDMAGMGDIVTVWSAFLDEVELVELGKKLLSLRPVVRPMCGGDDQAGTEADGGPDPMDDLAGLAVA